MSITLFVFVMGGIFLFGYDILHYSAHYFSADTSTIKLLSLLCFKPTEPIQN